MDYRHLKYFMEVAEEKSFGEESSYFPVRHQPHDQIAGR